MPAKPVDKARRKRQSLKKIGELIRAGVPFNPDTVSFETLQIAQNVGKVTTPQMRKRAQKTTFYRP